MITILRILSNNQLTKFIPDWFQKNHIWLIVNVTKMTTCGESFSIKFWNKKTTRQLDPASVTGTASSAVFFRVSTQFLSLDRYLNFHIQWRNTGDKLLYYYSYHEELLFPLNGCNYLLK